MMRKFEIGKEYKDRNSHIKKWKQRVLPEKPSLIPEVGYGAEPTKSKL